MNDPVLFLTWAKYFRNLPKLTTRFVQPPPPPTPALGPHLLITLIAFLKNISSLPNSFSYYLCEYRSFNIGLIPVETWDLCHKFFWFRCFCREKFIFFWRLNKYNHKMKFLYCWLIVTLTTRWNSFTVNWLIDCDPYHKMKFLYW